MRYVSYVRTATKEQSEDGEINRINEYAVQHGYEINELYVDNGYSTNSIRQSFKKVREVIQGGNVTLLTTSADRLFRSPEELATLFYEARTAGSRIYCIEGNVDSDNKMIETLVDGYSTLKKALKQNE